MYPPDHPMKNINPCLDLGLGLGMIQNLKGGGMEENKQRTLHTLHGKAGHEGNGPGGGHIEKGD